MRFSSRRWSIALAPSMGILIAAGVLQADLVNRSFEEGTDPGDVMIVRPGGTAIQGWAVSGADVWYVGTKWKPFLGVRSVGLPCGGAISQTLATEVDQEYEVRFSIAGDPTTPPAVKTITMSFGTESRNFTFDATGRSFNEMGWEARFWIFTAIEPTTTLTFTSPKGECSTAALDNVRIASVEIGVRAEGAREQGAAERSPAPLRN